MSLLIKMYQCHNCGNHFTRPNYFTAENPQGYPIKIPYCPDCISQNIEQAEYT